MNWPNRLSLLRVGLVPLIVLMIIIGASWSYGVALALFLVGGLTDWADGWMARRYRIVTNFGKFMDPVADKLLVLSAMISLCGQGLIPSWACVVVLFRELAVDGLRLVAMEQGRVIAAGKLGKIKTCTQMAMLVAYLLSAIGWLRVPALNWTLLAVAMAMTLWSGVDYFWKNRALFAGGLR